MISKAYPTNCKRTIQTEESYLIYECLFYFQKEKTKVSLMHCYWNEHLLLLCHPFYFFPTFSLLIISFILLLYFGEGNGTPLQYSCLENPMNGGAWWAAIYGVAQSRTRLKRLSSSRMLGFKISTYSAPYSLLWEGRNSI